MEFTAYLLSLLELIIVLMFIPLMYSYSNNKGKRLLWFSSPSFSLQSHPIPKLKKQRNLKKITEVSNVNDWNQPWVLTNSKFLPTDATECKKVWLLGPAGSGKTTLLEFMGIGQSHSDNIEATEGEEFITDCQWPNTIFVDTQGIYQVKGKADTEINEQIILDHAHQCADAIILVIPKLQRQDVTIFFEMVERMKNSHRALYVVHSLPQFEENSEILEYRKMMNDFLSEKENLYCRTENEENNVMVSWHGSGKETVCVNHFFIGNKCEQRLWNDRQISQLKDRIRSLNSNRYSLMESFCEASKEVGLRFYQFDHEATPLSLECNHKSVVDDEGNEDSEFSYNRQIVGIRSREVGNQTILGNTLDYRWLTAKMKSGVREQNLVICLSRISDLVLQIVNEKTILCSYVFLKLNDLEEYDEVSCIEYIHSSFPLDIHQGEYNEISISSVPATPCGDEDQSDSLIKSYPTVGITEDDLFETTPKILKSEYLEVSREMLYRIRLNG